jgi:hypothetical protein
MVFPVNDPRFCYAYRVKTLLSVATVTQRRGGAKNTVRS